MSPNGKHLDGSICDISWDLQIHKMYILQTLTHISSYILNYFPTRLLLDGEWELAFWRSTIKMSINRKNVYVFCDWCIQIIMHGHLLPVLRKVDAEIQHILYISIHRGAKNRIILYIMDKSHTTPSFVRLISNKAISHSPSNSNWVGDFPTMLLLDG